MAEKNQEFVYVEGPYREMCRVPADKLTKFEENKRKIKAGEPVMSDEERQARLDRMFELYKKGLSEKK